MPEPVPEPVDEDADDPGTEDVGLFVDERYGVRGIDVGMIKEDRLLRSWDLNLWSKNRVLPCTQWGSCARRGIDFTLYISKHPLSTWLSTWESSLEVDSCQGASTSIKGWVQLVISSFRGRPQHLISKIMRSEEPPWSFGSCGRRSFWLPSPLLLCGETSIQLNRENPFSWD